MREYMEELRRVQEEYDEKDRELKENKKKTEMELKSFLEKQIDLVKCKEQQEKILRSEEIEIMQAQKELDDLIEERKRLEEKRKRMDLRCETRNFKHFSEITKVDPLIVAVVFS